jgi:hypothetical protein
MKLNKRKSEWKDHSGRKWIEMEGKEKKAMKRAVSKPLRMFKMQSVMFLMINFCFHVLNH